MNLKDSLAIRLHQWSSSSGKLSVLSSGYSLYQPSQMTPMKFTMQMKMRPEMRLSTCWPIVTLDAWNRNAAGFSRWMKWWRVNSWCQWTDLYGWYSDDTKEIVESILKQNFSRIPVYDGDKGQCDRFDSTKRLKPSLMGSDNLNLRKILYTLVPETIFVDDLPKSLNAKSNGAILLDEYGGRSRDA